MTSATRPALEHRAARVERQPRSVRRRSARVLARVAVLVVFDVAAFLTARLIARLVLDPVTAETAFGARLAGPLASPGAPASLVFPAVLLAALVVGGSYTRHRPSVEGFRLFTAAAAATAAVAVTLATLIGVGGAFLHAIWFGAICFVTLAIGRNLAAQFVQRVWPRDRGALPGIMLRGHSGGGRATPRVWGDYTTLAEVALNPGAGPPDLAEPRQQLHHLALDGAEAVILTDDLPDRTLVPLAHMALDLGYRVIFPARAIEIEGIRPRLIWHYGEPFLELSTPVLRARAVLVKRITDLIGAMLLLLLAAPLMVLLALAVRLDSAGRAFYSQDRAGLGGRRFRMLKFRTMKVGADEEKHELSHLNRSGDVRLFKIPADPRVTRVGRFLRRWSLDELPQLINVLKGEMSLVGPRPFFEADLAAYEDRHFRRLDTKPGITGLWQVSGRSDVVDFEDVIFLDRQYIEQWSIWLDLSILARTIPAVLRRDGAY